MLDNNNTAFVMHVIGKALVNLLQNQTTTEQKENTTKLHNNIGFTGADAKSGSITAKYYIKNKKLEDWMMEKWLRKQKSGYSRLSKYHSQLNEVAVRKASIKSS